MGFRERSVERIHAIATGDERRRKTLAPIAATALFSLITLIIALLVVFERRMGLPGFAPSPWGVALGAPLLVGGLFLVMWATFTFAETKGTPVPLNPPPSLVTTGPYAYSRNPMLSGLFVLILGVGFLLDSILVTFGFVPLMIAANAWELKNIEEPKLEKRLGADYVEYRKRTPMFFPRLFR